MIITRFHKLFSMNLFSTKCLKKNKSSQKKEEEDDILLKNLKI